MTSEDQTQHVYQPNDVYGEAIPEDKTIASVFLRSCYGP